MIIEKIQGGHILFLMLISSRFKPSLATDEIDDFVYFKDSMRCVARMRRNKGETLVRVGGCVSSGMVVQALIQLLGKFVVF